MTDGERDHVLRLLASAAELEQWVYSRCLLFNRDRFHGQVAEDARRMCDEARAATSRVSKICARRNGVVG